MIAGAISFAKSNSGSVKPRRAPLAELALHPDLAAVPRDELLAQVEADAETLAAAPVVIALLLHVVEDPLARFGSDSAAPLVAYGDPHERDVSRVARRGELDLTAFIGVFDRVVDQVGEDLADAHVVGEHGR